MNFEKPNMNSQKKERLLFNEVENILGQYMIEIGNMKSLVSLDEKRLKQKREGIFNKLLEIKGFQVIDFRKEKKRIFNKSEELLQKFEEETRGCEFVFKPSCGVTGIAEDMLKKNWKNWKDTSGQFEQMIGNFIEGLKGLIDSGSNTPS